MAVKEFSLATCFERLERLMARDHPGVAPGGRTIAHVHAQRRERSVVLLHGMSASPAQFERVARDLYERGHNVVVPRLPHHGHIDPLSTAMERLRSEELYEAAGEYVAVARDLGERVTIAGFSLGGLLTAWAAQHFEFDRAVPVAPFFGVSWIPDRLMGPIAERLLRAPNRFHWWNPIVRERHLPAHGYPRYATHALAQSYLLALDVMSHANEGIAADELIFVTNAREAAVNNRAVRRLEERLRSHNPERLKHAVLTDIPFSHDIIEPLRHPKIAEQVFPTILSLIEGTS